MTLSGLHFTDLNYRQSLHYKTRIYLEPCLDFRLWIFIPFILHLMDWIYGLRLFIQREICKQLHDCFIYSSLMYLDNYSYNFVINITIQYYHPYTKLEKKNPWAHCHFTSAISSIYKCHRSWSLLRTTARKGEVPVSTHSIFKSPKIK